MEASATACPMAPIHEQSVSAMKAFLESVSISYEDCLEKSDINKRVLETVAKGVKFFFKSFFI